MQIHHLNTEVMVGTPHLSDIDISLLHVYGSHHSKSIQRLFPSCCDFFFLAVANIILEDTLKCRFFSEIKKVKVC